MNPSKSPPLFLSNKRFRIHSGTHEPRIFLGLWVRPNLGHISQFLRRNVVKMDKIWCYTSQTVRNHSPSFVLWFQLYSQAYHEILMSHVSDEPPNFQNWFRKCYKITFGLTRKHHLSLSLLSAEKWDDFKTSPISSRQNEKLWIVHIYENFWTFT